MTDLSELKHNTAIGPEQTIEMDGCSTIPQLFRHRCQTLGSRVAHREKDLGIWQSYTWTDYYENAKWIGLGLISMGLIRGQAVSLLSEDNKEWLYCDMGIIAAGGITNGIYTTDSAQQLAYLVNDSRSPFLFVENDEQLDKYLEASEDMPELLKVIVFDRDGLRGFTHERVMFLDDLIALGQAFDQKEPNRLDAEIDLAQPNDTAVLIYTSGTTGPPKGAMVSHRNLVYQIATVVPVLEISPDDEQLCFLPLCHIYERLLSVLGQLGCPVTVNFTESVETVVENMQEVAPHTFSAVPRFWEKVYSQVQIRCAEATALGRWAMNRAIQSGLERVALEEQGKPVPWLLSLKNKFWDWAVLSNLRSMIGMKRMRRGGSGAAPISPELLRWFSAIGVPLLEGYGATETTGVATLNMLADNTVGSVGKVIPGTEIRLDDSGELLVRGPGVFKGYWNLAEKTAETIRDGWLHTGDVATIDSNGAVTITGRIKDIIITAGGKNITPAEIESRLKFSPYISDAVIIGDKRKYLTCLIMIDQENVEKFAQDAQIPFSDFSSLCSASEVKSLIGTEVEAVNKQFARVEQIKDFRLIDILLTAEDEELTPTMKLKRGVVETRHEALINQMY
ncbi:MAG: long-chain fatty acid--CoA ligase [Burkholderiaceae bacterium]